MNILCVAAHPDDEVLGCGGTLARRAAEGHDCHVLIMAEGAMSRGPQWQAYKDSLQLRANEAGKILGIRSYSFGAFPDQEMDTTSILKITKCIETHVHRLRPQVIYTHWSGDLNMDHRLTNRAVLTACRPQPGFCVREIYAFEVPSATGWDEGQFQPNVYVNVDNYWTQKYRALEVYQEEMREDPHARSLGGLTVLNTYRGYTVGFECAEAFQLIRRVET